MRTRLTLRPGQRGTKKLLAQYGDRLVCVRYRYDGTKKKRFKTVELIVEEIDWEPGADSVPDDTTVAIRIGWHEKELQGKVKRAGGKWNPRRRVWEIRYDRMVELGLEGRLVQEGSI